MNQHVTKPTTGRLYLVGTPIGNLGDISTRAIETLKTVSLIAAEDTRATKKLLSRFDIHTPMMSFHRVNELRRTATLIDRLRQGDDVAVVSDAGMPGISDPGFPLVRQCVESGMPVDVIPGPSAVTTALLLSGFSPASFRFVGFLPRKGVARQHALKSIAQNAETAIFFESAQRIHKTLAELAPLLADRPIAIAREMTKLHQEVLRGTAAELEALLVNKPPRGELTVVVADSKISDQQLSEEDIASHVATRLAQGQKPREIAEAMAQLGCSKRQVYQLAHSVAAQTEDTD